MFGSHFGAAVAKIFNKHKDIPRKKFLETPNQFSQPELPGKKETKLYLPF